MPPLRFSVAPPPGYALQSASSRQSLTLSPDGTRLAFTALDSSGDLRLFVRDFNGVEPRQIAGTVGATRRSGLPIAGRFTLLPAAPCGAALWTGKRNRFCVTSPP